MLVCGLPALAVPKRYICIFISPPVAQWQMVENPLTECDAVR